MPDTMTQVAPWPTELADLVQKTTYRPGWRVLLADDLVRDPADTHGAEGRGLTLIITTNTINSYPPHERLAVNHFFIVPAATYNREAWQRWLFDQFAAVELHEAMEFFTVDGVKPFAPNHGPGCSPYTVTQLATDEQRRTSFRGEVSDG
jgi:hypothetical protein